jgi:hypothetical protein
VRKQIYCGAGVRFLAQKADMAISLIDVRFRGQSGFAMKGDIEVQILL